MPDISMCKNKDCPSKRDCYRYRAIPDEVQVYSEFDPADKTSCEQFIPVLSYPKYLVRSMTDANRI